ncbi:asparaginase [Tistrella mobilis]|uniref:asparaginase n=1 Tax=Tistrella mobilis TaxID=171437 RepID=UPI0035577BD2
MMSDPVLVEVVRGGFVESRHRGAVVVCDARGRVILALGDGDRPVFPRSATKPIQALQLIESGAADAMGLSAPELALSQASHNGEPMHVGRVSAWLDRMGLGTEDLICGAHWSSHDATARAMARDGGAPSRAHNNCSGKHCGFLATARHLGEAITGYGDRDHPVQRRWRDALSELGDHPLDDAPEGIDGCGIPVIAMPLRSLALAFARIADPSRETAARRDAMARLSRAVWSAPEMIAGTGRLCSAIARQAEGRVLAKVGAEGVYAAALPGLGLGVALKVEDGAVRAAETALLATLARLGVLDAADLDALAPWSRRGITSWAGAEVGVIRPSDAFG